jgi:hypothetical protein
LEHHPRNVMDLHISCSDLTLGLMLFLLPLI